jgi:hypothetical protein
MQGAQINTLGFVFSTSLLSTTMATQTQTVPDLTIFSRVSAIPLVNESLSTVHSTLNSYAFTSFPYHLAQNLSKSAYYYSEPIQIRLAPILCRADDIANKSLDAVESRYPTPFRITTQDIRGTANKAIDEKVKTPVYSVAQAIDQVGIRLSPCTNSLSFFPFNRNLHQ